MIKSIIRNRQDPEPNPAPQQSNSLYCICGHCQMMEQPIENVCCRKQPCISTTEFFESVVLDANVLTVAIVNRNDIYADDDDFTPSSYQKAAYRQWILWHNGYMGRGNGQVMPSCIVWSVRSRYPAPDGLYLGY